MQRDAFMPKNPHFHPNYGMIFFEGISLIYCLHLGLMKFDIVYILGYEIRYDLQISNWLLFFIIKMKCVESLIKVETLGILII